MPNNLFIDDTKVNVTTLDDVTNVQIETAIGELIERVTSGCEVKT